MKVCLMQRTTYSVSSSVRLTGGLDLNRGPKLANSGMADSCSAYLIKMNMCYCEKIKK